MSDTPFDCRAAADRLYEYLDGELTADDEIRVRAHLEQCAHCFRFYDFESAFLRFLDARRQAVDAPPALRRRILDAMMSEGDPDPS